MKPTVTIVLRARNEERWIGKTLKALLAQSFQDFEVVLVDNCSVDNTRKIFQEIIPQGRVLTIENFKPGQAINIGVAEGRGELVVILSAHCIPENDRWLESFVKSMANPKIAASYGRQLPLPTSHPLDRRDLLNTFGVESRIQKKDSFFHNANSIIRRNIWERFPFDENTPHIEDRIWAEQIIEGKYWIAYEADAAVYHYHGINHHQNLDRAQAISDILTSRTMVNGGFMPELFQVSASTTLYCFLGHTKQTHTRMQEILEKMEGRIGKGEVFVHSSVPAAVPQDVTYISRKSKDNDLTFVEILDNMLSFAAEKKIFPDCVAYLNLCQPKSSADYILQAVQNFYKGMYDSVFFAQSEYSNVWIQSGGEYRQIEANYLSRKHKEPIFIARYGLGMATRPLYIRSGDLVGKKVGIIEKN